MLIKELLENFGGFEKLNVADMDTESFNMLVPKAGPCLLATYKGAKDDVFLTLGVDPDEKQIRVAVENMFRGSSHVKYFPDTEDGYKDAKKYAESLRSVKVKVN